MRSDKTKRIIRELESGNRTEAVRLLEELINT